MVLSAFTINEPFTASFSTETIIPPSSRPESFPSTLIMISVFKPVITLSLSAIGTEFSLRTVIVTVAAEQSPSASQTWYSKTSVPR